MKTKHIHGLFTLLNAMNTLYKYITCKFTFKYCSRSRKMQILLSQVKKHIRMQCQL